MRQFTITAAESHVFARLSGDFNPLHVDPMAARRSHFGGTVVHGVQAFLKALDQWAAQRSQGFALQSAQVKFHGAIPTGAAVECEASETEGKLVLQLRGRHGVAQRCVVRYGDAAPAKPASRELARAGDPAAVTIGRASGLSGETNEQFDTGLALELFPNLMAFMPGEQLGAFLAATRIIGMHCPGLYSLFRKFDLEFSGNREAGGKLTWHVTDVDDRYSTIGIAIRSGSVSGRLDAMFRPAPARQESFAALRNRFRGDEFRSHRAIVLGGSRGLGELTAKLIAAGGGKVWISYVTGESDAIAVQNEIQEGGGAAGIFQFDVLRPPDLIPASLPSGEAPTHLYFFATPAIELNHGDVWDRNLFGRFCAFYAEGLASSVRAIRSWWPAPRLDIFYPSTVFIDQPEAGAAEYAAAKAAGEVVCRYLAADRADIRCYIARLPRMLTDQTNAPGIDRESMPAAVDVLREAMRPCMEERAG